MPLVIEPLDLGWIGEPAALLVDDQRAVFPGIPVAEHHFHELVGAVVAQVMLEMGSLPMLCASPSLTEVTTFQAARPPVIRSRVAKRRATSNGS